jgi:hypothetical protein
MKNVNLILKIAFLFLFSNLFIQCENEPVEKTIDVFKKDSDLYNYVKTITDNQYQATCAYFQYPITLFTYNSNYDIIDRTVVISDAEFLFFLTNINSTTLININYPITTTLNDGTQFSINNNDELEANLEECYRETILEYYNGPYYTPPSFSKCVWKVDYKDDTNNEYYLSTFESNGDGSFQFHHDNEIHNATWSFIFINEEFHLNISIEGVNPQSQSWNHDWLIDLSEPNLTIVKNGTIFTLSRICYDQPTYSVGNEGPAGGYVIYDKGFYSNGWRYIEASTDYLTNTNIQWGCEGSSIFGTSSSFIGSGLTNTKSILNHHFTTGFYSNPTNCNILNNGSVAAQKTSIFNLNGYTDWVLPSSEECELIMNQLYLQNIGNITDSFWSSTQLDQNNSYYFNINTENIEFTNKSSVIIKTRPIRYF